jgi:hypothetical protein
MHYIFFLIYKMDELHQWLKIQWPRIEKALEFICKWLGFIELAKLVVGLIETIVNWVTRS